MKAKVFLPMAVLVFCAAGAAAQYPSAPQPVMVSPDAIAMIANELSNIAKNVQTMNERLKAVTDKGNAAAPALTDPRQKIILGIRLSLERNSAFSSCRPPSTISHSG